MCSHCEQTSIPEDFDIEAYTNAVIGVWQEILAGYQEETQPSPIEQTPYIEIKESLIVD